MIDFSVQIAENDGQKGTLLAPLVVSTEVAVNPLSAAPHSNKVATSVYRYYDRHDILIYVGITSAGINRNRQHNADKEWWPFVVRQEVDHFTSRDDASAREIELIRFFRPPFNRQHNPEHEVLRAAYLALRDSDILKASKDIGGIVVARRKGVDLFCTLEAAANRITFRTRLEDAPLASFLQLVEQTPVSNMHGMLVGRLVTLEHNGPSVTGVIRLKPIDPKTVLHKALALPHIKQLKPKKIAYFKRILLHMDPSVPLTGKWDL